MASHETAVDYEEGGNGPHDNEVDYEDGGEDGEAFEDDYAQPVRRRTSQDEGEGEEEGVITEGDAQPGFKKWKGKNIPAPYPPIPPNNTLFISRYQISGPTVQDQFREVCEKFGAIKSIKVMPYSTFVEYVDIEDAIRAREGLHFSRNFGSDSIICDFRKIYPPKNHVSPSYPSLRCPCY